MTQVADNNGYDPESTPSAGGETQVPKHRLDEVSARLRAAEDALRVKDELINQAYRPQPQAQQINYEEMGFDERQGRAVVALAEQIASKKIEEVSGQFRNQLAFMAQKTAQNEFLSQHPDKKSYIPRINALRAKHYQETGSGLDMEAAYKMIAYDDMVAKQNGQARAPQAPATPAAMTPQHQTPAAQPAATPQYQAPPQANAEQSWEELENTLNQQLSAAGGTL